MGITKGLSFNHGLKVRRSQACKESQGRGKNMYTRPGTGLDGPEELKESLVLEHSGPG